MYKAACDAALKAVTCVFHFWVHFKNNNYMLTKPQIEKEPPPFQRPQDKDSWSNKRKHTGRLTKGGRCGAMAHCQATQH